MKHKSISLSRVLFLVIIVSVLFSVYSYKSFAGFFSDTDLSIENDILSFQKNNKYVNLTVTIIVNGTERIITDNMKWFKEKIGDSWKFGANVTIPNTAQGGFIANNLEEVRFKVDTNVPLRFFTDGFEYDDGVRYRFDFSDIFGSLYYEENETQEDGSNITVRRNVPFKKTVENGTGILSFNVSMMQFSRGQTIFLDPTIYIWDGTVIGEYTNTVSPYSVENAYNVVVVGDIAYVTSDPDDELTLLNISDPSSITTKSSFSDTVPPYSIDGPRGLQVIPQESGNGWYVYITSTNDDCFTILNVSDNYTITALGSINNSVPPYSLDIGSGQSSENTVFIDGDFAYIATTVDDGLTILNITNKSNPKNAGYAQSSTSPYSLDGANAVVVKDNIAYVISGTDDGVTLLNVTNKSYLENISWYSQSDAPLSSDGPIDLELVGNKLFITSQPDNGITIFNISNNYTITGVGGVYNVTSIYSLNLIDQIEVDGNYSYVSTSNVTTYGGGKIINITDLSNPTILNQTVDYSGSCMTNNSRGIFYKDSYVYLTSQTTDCLFIFRVWRTDEEYPLFENINDNNGTITGSGIAMFNTSIWETNGTSFLEINGTNYSSQYTPSYCYQESANESASCGGYNTGNYSNITNNLLHDGNWSSNTQGSFSNIITYIKPINANRNSTWQIKDSTESTNLSLIQCWDYNESYIILNVSVNFGQTADNWTCYNNGWKQLKRNSFSPMKVYEEGIVWDTSTYNVSLTLTTGVYPYYWGSWGNGTSNNYNISSIRYYTVDTSAPAGQANHTRNITLITSLSPLITKKAANTKHTSITSSLISFSGDIGKYIRRIGAVIIYSLDNNFRKFIKRLLVVVENINGVLYDRGSFNKKINIVINYVTQVTKTASFFRNFWAYFTINLGLSTSYSAGTGDTTYPWFETIPEGVEIAYNTDFPDPEFLANDDINISSFTVNDSKFTITTQYVEIEGTPMWQGILKNATVIPVGNYLLNITINDTSNNLNSTIYSLNVTGAGAVSYLSNASMAFQIQPVTSRKLTATRILINSFNPVILIRRVFYGGKSIIQAIFINPLEYETLNLARKVSVNENIALSQTKYRSILKSAYQNVVITPLINTKEQLIRSVSEIIRFILRIFGVDEYVLPPTPIKKILLISPYVENEVPHVILGSHLKFY